MAAERRKQLNPSVGGAAPTVSARALLRLQSSRAPYGIYLDSVRYDIPVVVIWYTNILAIRL